MLYLDTSAIVKKYVDEQGAGDLRKLIDNSAISATASIARVETAAAFAKAIRIGSLEELAARQCHRSFLREWRN